MKKKDCTRCTPPLLNIYFHNVLMKVFLLFLASPAVGQVVFQTDILETGNPAREFTISQAIGEIEDYWIVDIDVAALDSLIQSQGSNIAFQFEVGTQFRWILELSESYASAVGQDTLWTKYLGEADSSPAKPVDLIVSEAYFNGKIQEPGFTYQFLSMYEFDPLDSLYSNKYALIEKKAAPPAGSTCSIPFPNVPGGQL